MFRKPLVCGSAHKSAAFANDGKYVAPHPNVHIGILFSGLVGADELSFLRTSPDSIVITPEFSP